MFDGSSMLFLNALALLAAVAVGAIAFVLNRRLCSASERLQTLERQLTLVCQSISGLTAGAVGIDRRMKALEQRERVLTERQETYENQQADEQPYGTAIRLVQQGAGVGRLVQELELSESEADLIVRLHGHRDTA